jgi:hypothetical protein
MKLERMSAALAAGAFSILASAALSSAMAMPLPQPPQAVAGQPDVAVELAHGCHPGVQRDNSGWHFHTRACVRRNTAPPGLYGGPSYRRFHRGPICSYRCKFVGPVKTCSQVCR